MKKILITVGVVVLLLIIAFFYLDHRNRTLSPPGEVSLTHQGLSVSISYSRPFVRDRVIFGPPDVGALQPYGVYWRLGANEATEISFNMPVTIGDLSVDAGTYRIYAFPGENAFEFRLNSELGAWGAFEPDQNEDIGSFNVPVEEITSVEQYTISLVPEQDGVIFAIFEWSDVRLKVPIKKK